MKTIFKDSINLLKIIIQTTDKSELFVAICYMAIIFTYATIIINIEFSLFEKIISNFSLIGVIFIILPKMFNIFERNIKNILKKL